MYLIIERPLLSFTHAQNLTTLLLYHFVWYQHTFSVCIKKQQLLQLLDQIYNYNNSVIKLWHLLWFVSQCTFDCCVALLWCWHWYLYLNCVWARWLSLFFYLLSCVRTVGLSSHCFYLLSCVHTVWYACCRVAFIFFLVYLW